MKLQDFRGAADDGDEALKFLKALAALSGLNEETQALRRTHRGSGDVVSALSCGENRVHICSWTFRCTRQK